MAVMNPNTTLTSTVKKTTAPKPVTTATNNAYNDPLVNSIYDKQAQSQLSQLKAERDAAIAKLNQQKKDTAVSYQGQRNQASVIATQNTQKLRELMAANGLNATGENITAQASANSDRLGAINSLNLQQQSAVNGINGQINDLNNPARQQAALAQIESERSQALLNSRNQAQDRAWQQYTFNNLSASDTAQLNWSKQQYNQDAAWRQYTYNNMSAADKAQLNWAKQQYGEDAAWKMYELQYNGELQKSTNQAQIDAYTSGFPSP